MKKSLFILAIVLLLTLTITMTAFATKPINVRGYFDEFVPDVYPSTYCVHTGESWGVPDGFLNGCVVQPYSEGLAQHGIMSLTVDGKSGVCLYNIRTFDLDGIARIVINRCTGDLAGFHMKAVGWTNGLWEGTYHFAP